MRVACTTCDGEVPVGTLGPCPACAGILQPLYTDDEIACLATIFPGRGIDRYRTLLPTTAPLPTLGEGNTPLLPSRRLGPSLGLRELYFKHEGVNPSGAFKDRLAALVAALAIDTGADSVLTASSGNLAAAIATYCAAAGLACTILLEPGTPPAKLRQTVAAGARVLPVAGLFARPPAQIRELMEALAGRMNAYLAFAWAPVNPYILEGVKTISYEIGARLSGAPDVVIAPVGGGDMLTGQWRGYLELQRAAVIDQLPRMIGVQASGAAPLVRAFREGRDRVPSLDDASSKISGINVPFSGDHALQAIRASRGVAFDVPDELAFAAQARLARVEGIWVEPVGAVPVAALPLLLEAGHIRPDERVVCILTGAGFKDATLATEAAAAVSEEPPLPFSVDAIANAALDFPRPARPDHPV